MATGGLELTLGLDLLVASDWARFADTHASVGILPFEAWRAGPPRPGCRCASPS